eukprot:GHVS01108648.1.p1 GENE.GHVS01108648.1~~GHVS01108648.1.p1  ORF type:complete len:224 (+),score=55.43 GHVS01108648.1:1152-1823(+)
MFPTQHPILQPTVLLPTTHYSLIPSVPYYSSPFFSATAPDSSAGTSSGGKLEYSAGLDITTFSPDELSIAAPPPLSAPTAEEVLEELKKVKDEIREDIRDERKARREQHISYGEALRHSMANPSTYAKKPDAPPPLWTNTTRAVRLEKERRERYGVKQLDVVMQEDFKKKVEKEKSKIRQKLARVAEREDEKKREEKQKKEVDYQKLIEREKNRQIKFDVTTT